MDLQQAHRRFGRLPVLYTPFEERMSLIRPGPLSDWVRQLHVERVKYQLLTDEVIRGQTKAGKGVLRKGTLNPRGGRTGNRQTRAVPDDVVVKLRPVSRGAPPSPGRSSKGSRDQDREDQVALATRNLSVSGRRSRSPGPVSPSALPPIELPIGSAGKGKKGNANVDTAAANQGVSTAPTSSGETEEEMQARQNAVRGGYTYDSSKRMAMPQRPAPLNTVRLRGGLAHVPRTHHDGILRRVDRDINFAGRAPTFGTSMRLGQREKRRR